MQVSREFRVPGRAAEVIHRFADIDAMAKLMPGTTIEGRDEEGNVLGAMMVAFGPKRINFQGKVACATDIEARTGTLRGRGIADMRSARIEVRIAYALRDDPAATTDTTIVALTADADLQGVLAEFARTGGPVVARALMDDFAERVTLEWSRPVIEDAPQMSSSSAATAGQAAPALSATGLLWRIIKTAIAQPFRRKA